MVFNNFPAAATRAISCSIRVPANLNTCHRCIPNRTADRAFARSASISRLRGSAVVISDAISSRAVAAISSIARSNAGWFAFDGLLNPLSLRTNCSDAERISSSVAGGSKLNNVRMFLHIIHFPGMFSWQSCAAQSSYAEVGRRLASRISRQRPSCCLRMMDNALWPSSTSYGAVSFSSRARYLPIRSKCILHRSTISCIVRHPRDSPSNCRPECASPLTLPSCSREFSKNSSLVPGSCRCRHLANLALRAYAVEAATPLIRTRSSSAFGIAPDFSDACQIFPIEETRACWRECRAGARLPRRFLKDRQ